MAALKNEGQTAMTWTKVTTHNEPPGAFEGDWVSGIYKIVRYEANYANPQGPNYQAYYIRKPDKCWGYHVDEKTPFYPTLKAAQAACAGHAKAVQP
jgi:hypothetical protein